MDAAVFTTHVSNLRWIAHRKSWLPWGTVNTIMLWAGMSTSYRTTLATRKQACLRYERVNPWRALVLLAAGQGQAGITFPGLLLNT